MPPINSPGRAIVWEAIGPASTSAQSRPGTWNLCWVVFFGRCSGATPCGTLFLFDYGTIVVLTALPPSIFSFERSEREFAILLCASSLKSFGVLKDERRQFLCRGLVRSALVSVFSVDIFSPSKVLFHKPVSLVWLTRDFVPRPFFRSHPKIRTFISCPPRTALSGWTKFPRRKTECVTMFVSRIVPFFLEDKLRPH